MILQYNTFVSNLKICQTLVSMDLVELEDWSLDQLSKILKAWMLLQSTTPLWIPFISDIFSPTIPLIWNSLITSKYMNTESSSTVKKLDCTLKLTQLKFHGENITLQLLWSQQENSWPLKQLKNILKMEPKKLLFQLLQRTILHCSFTELITSIIKKS